MCVPVVRNSVKKEEREEEEDFTIYQKMGTGISLKKKKKTTEIAPGRRTTVKVGNQVSIWEGSLS